MVGTFALPAYAITEIPDTYVPANVQEFTADEVDELVANLAMAQLEVDSTDSVAEMQRLDKEAADKAAAEKQGKKDGVAADKPADVAYVGGSGSGAILGNALAQVGVMQDCTALVENALRAAGYPAGDLGTQVHEYAQFGSVIPNSQAGPGDILVRGGHVAVLVSTDGTRVTAVHGGWAGNQTVVGDDGTPLSAYTVVRVG